MKSNHLIMNSTLFLFVFLLNNPSFSRIDTPNPIKILATGETHAMLDACNCADSPSGGLSKRATVLKRLRIENELLLLDAGGFAGGGIYDFYTEGRARDSLRTLITIQAMAQMGYDAAAIGDEELQLGITLLKQHAEKAGLPLISANCRYNSGEYCTAPYRIVKKGSVAFGITAVTPREKLFSIDSSVVIDDPVAAVKKIWKKLKKKSDYQIILSHLGEDAVQELIKQFPACDIVVNGHRKRSVQPVVALDNQILMQFGFQGKYISVVDLSAVRKVFHPYVNDWIVINDTIRDDNEMRTLIDPYYTSQLPRKTVFDLYIMSQCPYGIPALRDLHRFSEQFPTTELSVWFIGDIQEDGSLKSLHGEEELFDEKIWLAVKHLYPDMWSHFIYLVSVEGYTAKRALIDLELDTEKILDWAKSQGIEALTNHYYRSQRQNIEASPTLFINNRIYHPEVSYLRLAKEYCGDVPVKSRPPVCDSLPECFEDNDCRQKGKVGACVKLEDAQGGTCSFKDAVQFDFVIVIPDSALVHTEQSSIVTTEELFPGVRMVKHRWSSEKGKELIQNNKPGALPLYLFDKKVTQTANYEKIKSGLKDIGEWYTFKDGVMKKHFFFKRKPSKGIVELFIDPFFPDISKVLGTVLNLFPELKGISIQPVIFEEIISEQSPQEEKMRHEEALRWLVLSKYYKPGVFAAYLNSYQLQPGSSYWFSVLKEQKINVDKFVKQVKKNNALLKYIWKDIEALGIREPVELLVNNQELILIKNQKFLEEILNGIVGE